MRSEEVKNFCTFRWALLPSAGEIDHVFSQKVTLILRDRVPSLSAFEAGVGV